MRAIPSRKFTLIERVSRQGVIKETNERFCPCHWEQLRGFVGDNGVRLQTIVDILEKTQKSRRHAM